MKICIVAPPSAGKTTTAREVVKILKKVYKVNAEVAEEYARKYIRDNWDGQHPIKDPHQQYPITLGQIETETTIAKLHDVVVCDSSSFLGYVYAKMMVEALPEDQKNRPMYQKVLKDLHEIALRELPGYDFVFLFDPPGEVFQDGVRAQKDGDSQPLFERIRGFMYSEGVQHVLITGANEEEKARKIVDLIMPHIQHKGISLQKGA